MVELAGKSAVVTGATSGIGRAIVRCLMDEGAKIIAISRSETHLKQLKAEVEEGGSVLRGYEADFQSRTDVEKIAERIRTENSDIDVLVHCAGYLRAGAFEETSVDDLERHFLVNMHAPYVLTQFLLPTLKKRKGQVVFVISSVCYQPGKSNLSAYVASKLALKGVADCLREEVNTYGVRVMSIYPGRTATAMQAEIYAQEGRKYQPENLLQPEEIAGLILHSLKLPDTAEVTDLSVRPFRKS